MSQTAGRSPQEIFDSLGGALEAGDLDAIADHYADDAVFITREGVLRGRDGVRHGYARLLADLPGASWELPTVTFEDDVLFFEWKAASRAGNVEDGVDTCVFRGGAIRAHTVRYTLRPPA